MSKYGIAGSARLALLALSAFASSAALAAEFDGKSNLVCAATDAVVCTESLACRQGATRAFELPEFMYVNFQRKVVHARTADAATLKVESPIVSQHASERSLVLQGFENNQGWTLSVDRKGGRMTTTVTGSEATVVLFGVCTPI